MKGQAHIEPPKKGDDVRDLWKVVAAVCKYENRQWLVKLPSGAAVSADFNGSDETVILDLSNCGVLVSGCLNGAFSTGVALYAVPPSPVT